MPACLLAIDSSTERLCLALQAGEHACTHEQSGGALASAQLLPQLVAMLADAGVAWQALDAVAFARGPGAFTGLRTACAVAQGLALGAGKPVLPIDSLMLVADDARGALEPAPADIWVAMDARMGEVYAARYQWQRDAWQVLDAPALYELDALHARWQATPPAVVAGSALDAFGERLHTGAALRVPQEHDRPAALLRLAQAAWRSGAAVDAAEALPLYLRDKVASTTAEREAMRAAEASR